MRKLGDPLTASMVLYEDRGNFRVQPKGGWRRGPSTRDMWGNPHWVQMPNDFVPTCKRGRGAKPRDEDACEAGA